MAAVGLIFSEMLVLMLHPQEVYFEKRSQAENEIKNEFHALNNYLGM